MAKENKENLRRMRLCPRFDTCSVPKCPLDSLIEERIQLKGEPTCPYITPFKNKRIRPIPRHVREFLEPTEGGGFKSIFEQSLPEVRGE